MLSCGSQEKPTEITCPHCQTKLKASEDHQGKTVRCPKCKQLFVIRKSPDEKTVSESPKSKLSRSKAGRIVMVLGLVMLIVFFLAIGIETSSGELKGTPVFGLFLIAAFFLFLAGATVTVVSNILRAETTKRRTTLIIITGLGYLAMLLALILFVLQPFEGYAIGWVFTGIILITISYHFPISAKPKREKPARLRREMPLKPEGINYETVVKEVSKLPLRDDNLYKWRAVWKGCKATLSGTGLVILGLLMVFIDIYTPARIPFGWLLGLAAAGLGVLSFLLGGGDLTCHSDKADIHLSPR